MRDIQRDYLPGGGDTLEIIQYVRDQGFKKAIVQLYEHRCALCGIRMLTLDGHTVVEAAHIIPWRESRDDNRQTAWLFAGCAPGPLMKD